jgi:predicted GNAT family N-acyltransferase
MIHAGTGLMLEPARWTDSRQRDALKAIRLRVFVQEQQVPEALEWDALDLDAYHLLARDADGQALGCGRLTSEHKIGRMAVLADCRGQGIGQALLRALIAQARAQGWTQVSLDAQLHALEFYRREGFQPYGEVFDDAGIAHQAMRLRWPP